MPTSRRARAPVVTGFVTGQLDRLHGRSASEPYAVAALHQGDEVEL